MGYVGLPLALLFSEEHFSITGFDIDSSKVATLNRVVRTSFVFPELRYSRPRRTASAPPSITA
jgi:UDP-N-acetyl-D-mannosaminuronate dehydrogenase